MGGRVTAVKPVVELAVGEYLSGLAAATPVPGGGSAAALAGAMGSGLLCMVTRIAMRKAKDAPAQESLRWLEIEFERCLENLGVLSQEDIDAYDAVVLARKEAGKESRRFADCVAEATRVPLDTADAADRALRIADRLRPLALPVTVSDFETGCYLLETAFKGGMANAAINLPDLHPDHREQFQQRYDALSKKRSK
ncbi:MAG: cyclodeaminase/cyclohydrolase family protein [Chloroflexi bacterium]|nr:MAG: cyclodeaminase/cyclohydrolase family protein [Chloroflexota bacterium]